MRRVPSSAVKLGVFVAITAVVGAALASLVGNLSLVPSRSYSAVFTDVLGMYEGDDVRLSGVVVGKVSEIELVDGKRAKVTFDVDETVPVYRDAQIHARYADVVGNRYLAIIEEPGQGEPMPEGGTFGVEQTKPALNLTVLFNGFQPLFEALSPKDVNQLSYEIIQTLQGESGTLAQLMRNTAELTKTLADKDAVIGRVVNNLTAVLATVDKRDAKLTELIDQFRDLMRGLAGERDTISRSLPKMADLLDAGSGLLREVREPLKADIEHLGELSGNLAANKHTVDEVLRQLPGKLAAINRTASYGSWFNFYLCRADVRVSLLGQAIQLQSPASVEANERDTVCAGRPR
ncbi:MAG: MCE family protein [Actinophytocola sp.]|nr:MCE family protein [Actinophytocola sp.]